jgi:hypothetical protein
MKVNVITTQRHRYGGKVREVGDEYEVVGDTQAKLVTALKWARRHDAEETVEAVAPQAAKQKRAYVRTGKYRRRDMVAEE